MSAFDTEVNATYSAVDKLFSLKAKRQIKGTGIQFTRFLEANDLVKPDIKFYILEINSKPIRFKTARDLYIHLINYAVELHKESITELKYLEKHKREDMYFDDVRLDPKMDYLWYQQEKLVSFIEHLKVLLEKLSKT